ncbi:HIT family protein [Candidatus Woesearchaeota archaeon]|nr:HIT family protein [Candidatus Woesearchaeota archaeon]
MTEPKEENIQDALADQKQNCLFCQIIAGKTHSRKVYEDELCIGILDINPANPGHVLVLPKEHYPILPLMPPSVMDSLFVSARKISLAMLRYLKAEGSNIFIANGSAAGQKAPHAMIHIIPRTASDGVKTFTLPQHKIKPEDAEKLQQLIAARVQAALKEATPVKTT